MKKKLLSQKVKMIKNIEKIKGVINNTQRVVGDVDNITKVISNTLYMKGNIAVDLQNHSLISVSNIKDIA